MHRNAADNWHQTDSPIRRLPAGAKLALALATVIGVLAIPRTQPLALAAVALMLVLWTLLARLHGWRVIKRLLLFEPLALGIAGLTLLQPQGWRVFLWLAGRSTVCLLALILLSGTTPLGELLAVLRRLRVPALLVTTLALMHRYLGVLLEESLRMRRARAARTFSAGRRRNWQVLAGVAGQLFLRSVDRSERIYAAMCARGWR